ncbi:cytochrome c [Caenispirillum bisanense]|uniref:c-type cytochrome n=1 Tax=Caenispirillum bisanense TaxID=414052 RepID=UPI0031CFE1E8
MRLRLLAASALVLTAVAAAAPAQAQQQQQPTYLDIAAVVNARQDTMKAMNRAMKELAAMIEENQNFDAARVAELAGVIQDNTARIPHQFPQGSLIPGSEATKDVWEDPEAFAERSRDANVAAEALADRASLVEDADGLRRAFKDVALSCRACHRTYRKPF